MLFSNNQDMMIVLFVQFSCCSQVQLGLDHVSIVHPPSIVPATYTQLDSQEESLIHDPLIHN